MNKTLSETIISSVLGIIASIALCIGIMPSLRAEISFLSIVVVVSLLITFLVLIFYNKFTMLISLICTVFIGSIIYLKFVKTLPIKWYLSYFNNWLTAPDLIPKSFDNFYSILTEWIVIVLITIFVYLYIVKLSSFAVYAVGVAALYIGLSVQNYRVLGLPFFISLALIFTYYFKDVYSVKYLSAYKIDKKDKNTKVHNKQLLKPSVMSIAYFPIGLLTLLLVMMVPINEKPLLGELGNKIQDMVSDQTQRIAESLNSDILKESLAKNFSLNSSGFGDASKLGGNVRNSDKHVLTVESPIENIYLEGNSNDFYNGSAWTSSKTHLFSFVKNDEYSFYPPIVEKTAGLYITMGRSFYEKLSSDTNQVTVKVTFEDFLTRSVFTLPNSENVKVISTKKNDLLQNTGELLVGTKALSKGFSYETTSGIPLEWTADVITAARLTKKSAYKYSDLFGTKTQYNFASFTSDDQNLMVTRAETFYSMYLQLPVNLPKRVRDLAATITFNQKTNYDKAKAIEKYLSENYTYTLTPGDVPEGVDFVDYFLFEKKQGYCVYYASAMTVLLRCVEVPTRYVEGFKLPEKDGESNSYQVTLKQGHAWPEVYFEGLGFMVFEPTTIYTKGFYSSESTPAPSQKSTATISPSPSPTPSPSVTGQETETSSLVPTPSQTEEGLPPTNKKININPSYIAIFFIVMILVVLIAVIILNRFRYKYFTKKAVMAPHSAAICSVFGKILCIMGFNYIQILSTETLIEYKARLIESKAFKTEGLQAAYDKACDIFINARYTGLEATSDMAWEILKCYMQLVALLKLQNGSIWFFVQRYFIGRL